MVCFILTLGDTVTTDLIMIEIIASCHQPACRLGKFAWKTCLVVSVGQWWGIKDISPSFRSNKTAGTNSSNKAASDGGHQVSGRRTSCSSDDWWGILSMKQPAWFSDTKEQTLSMNPSTNMRYHRRLPLGSLLYTWLAVSMVWFKYFNVKP